MKERIRLRADAICREAKGGCFAGMACRWIGQAIRWAVRNQEAALERHLRIPQDRVVSSAASVRP